VTVALTPPVRAFLDDLQSLVEAKPWPDLDRGALDSTVVDGSARIVLRHHADPHRNVSVTAQDRTVEVAYGPERISFTRADEAIRFVEMLGDGRVVLVVHRNPVWTTMRSYRDGLALPFRKTGEPWPNLRFAVERREFGFG
jgi:hypothetical protein